MPGEDDKKTVDKGEQGKMVKVELHTVKAMTKKKSQEGDGSARCAPCG